MALPSNWQQTMAEGGNYNLSQMTTNPFAVPGQPDTYMDPNLYNYWAGVMGRDIYGRPTFGAGMQEAALTGKYQGQDTLAGLQQKQSDLMNQARIAQMQGDSARADKLQQLAQQTQDQANAMQMSRATGYVPGTGTGPGQQGGQLTAEQRNFYLQQYGYDPGAQGTAGATQYGGQTLAGRVQTEAEKQAERNWQYQQAMMSANPENAAVTAAMRGAAPWQARGSTPGAGQGGTTGWQTAMAGGGGGGQAGTAEQGGPNWGRAGMAAPREMSAQAYDQMSPSQKAAFGSYAKAAGGSAADYESQLNIYRPQRTQATTGSWGG